MTNLTVIENKISAIRKYLKILGRYKKYTQKEIENNLDLKGAVERYLYLAVQATIDLAEAVIAYKKLRKPSTLSESFYILKEENIISDKLSEKLVKMTGFRNVIAHDYDRLDYSIVFDVLKNKLKDVEDFLKKISKL
ncbi:MAG: hypothetical protein A3C43_01465 [Candidatus Schekmanbacteria bacterium RIFCSPHIGHO2_02_FULL_38_11]|uniref:DUF86 domain-containing protein n=1 Tax=Candidatus Schekmanbacteria bacterium RIFCSPLOWO2_12_FULL_38_15 TaxID=1817883 RepID=A0A1F7SDL6_9BACT|nr:MAG: hypothetical protein A2043_01695 [Candidatus Schekmanbacteria bacterium GWA2_38_9]OGL48339.1 MAG: hypothetical protein A3H37_05040 [Candidatus Schekmanbacteria bacterium RIFCSPLOWO2_02_FULL_38_14]OGL51865.1 MAG: hypothetical protein A3G31_05645 [Candidatus Schekmanbacteria bacterium RIFCSPLOWO2_12_FULL_38_15]OGL51953.1 MAG: hypothetical protein A3C43_01465 [Candidatus Schekmanbacteria bacterium RIFCSPHIGHO2_02_FULL_38_11]